jgi:hypothetical protein
MVAWAAELKSWAGLMGYGQMSPPPIFFCSVSFLFCFIFYFQISNLVLLNYFAGLNYLFSLQDFEFEITYQIWV